MATEDYLPTRDDDLPPWFANFAAKLPSYNVVLTISAPELAIVAADNTFMQAIMDAVEQAKQESKEWVAFKNLEVTGAAGGPTPITPAAMPPTAISPRPPGILARTRDLVRRIKANPNYNSVIGEDLGIIGSETASGGTVKPDGSVASSGGFTATVKFKKGGFDGVEIQSQRAGETAWVRIATDSFSPYIDNRPPLLPGQPEERRYRLRYLNKDEPVGDFSDVISVVVGP